MYVTHDQVEAMTLGHRVAVLRDGVIQQCDAPQRLFDAPANLFVGAFIGSPAMNLVEARLSGETVSFGTTELRLPGAAGERDVVLGLRPTSFVVAGPAVDPGWARLRVRLDVVEQLGSECNLLFTVDAPPVATEDVKAAIGGESGADEGRLLADDRRARFTARIHGRPPAQARGEVELAIDPSQLHLFDRDTGARARTPARGGEGGMSLTSRRAAAVVVAGIVALGALLVVLLADGEGKSLAPAKAAAEPPPANAVFDYQIGGDYPLPDGVRSSRATGTPATRRRTRPTRSVTSTPTRRRRTSRESTAPTSASNWPSSLVLSRARRRPALGRRVPGRHPQRGQAAAGRRTGSSR